MSAKIIPVDFKTRKRVDPVLTEAEQAAENVRLRVNAKIIKDLNEILESENNLGQDLRQMILVSFDAKGECTSMIDLSGEDTNKRHLLKIKSFYEFIKRKLSQPNR